MCIIYSDRVQSLCYLQLTRQLVSCSSDGGIAVWNMDVSREEVRGGAGKAGGRGMENLSDLVPSQRDSPVRHLVVPPCASSGCLPDSVKRGFCSTG